MSETPTKRKRGPGRRTSSEAAVAGELGELAADNGFESGRVLFGAGGVSAGSAATVGVLSDAAVREDAEEGAGRRVFGGPGDGRTLSAPAAVVAELDGGGRGVPSTSPSSASGVSGASGAGGGPRTPESKPKNDGVGGGAGGMGSGQGKLYLPPHPSSMAMPEGMLGSEEEGGRAPTAVLSRYIHIQGDEGLSSPTGSRHVLSCRWRQKEKVKTTNVALVLCLNLSVDPPDLIRIDPCARLECWVDPTGMRPQQATELIGKRLLEQYERWQGKARYKISLDPTLEDVRKLCASCRKNAHSDRVLFHYNGHGVPRTTPNGEVWVFNSKYTQYIPLSFHTLRVWVGKPALYIFDCSSAGYLLQTYASILNSPESEGGEMRDEDWRAWKEAQEEGKGRAGGGMRGLGLQTPEGQPQAPEATPQSVPPTPPTPLKGGTINLDTIMLCACRVGETLPQSADVPADVFTACLTTPIPMALRWVIRNSLLKDDGLNLDLLDKIPGKVTDRKSPLGEINWIFTTVTDTIAWNVLPRELFQKLFRQDLLLATLFRNFLLAERVMRDLQCTPCSYPPLPRTFSHPMWQAWDLAAEMCLVRVAHSIRKKDAGDSETDGKYPWLHSVDKKGPGFPDSSPGFMPSSFFSEQLTAFEIWLDLREGQIRRSPEHLPVVLQVLLSQNHRLRALSLLARFLDMGNWAVELSLSVGIFPYVLKLLQSPAGELRKILVFIWAKILAWDASCKVDLVKDRGHIYFLSFLADDHFAAEHRALAAFIAAVVADGHPRGQAALLGSSALPTLIIQLTSERSNSLLRQWSALCLGRLCAGSDEARLSVLGVSQAEADDVVGVGEGNSSDPSASGESSWRVLIPLLAAPEPETRAAVSQALGLLVRPERGPVEPEGRRTPRSDMMMDVGLDGRVTPRQSRDSRAGTPLPDQQSGNSTDLEAEQAELDRAVRSNDFFSALTGHPPPEMESPRPGQMTVEQQLNIAAQQQGNGDFPLTRRGVCELALVQKLVHVSLHDPCHLVRIELSAALHRFSRTHSFAMGNAIDAFINRDGAMGNSPSNFSGDNAGMSSPNKSTSPSKDSRNSRESPLPVGGGAVPGTHLGSKEAQDRAIAKLAQALYKLSFDPHVHVRNKAREVCTELGIKVVDEAHQDKGMDKVNDGAVEDEDMRVMDLTQSMGASELPIPMDASGIYDFSRGLLSKRMLPLAMMYDPKLRYTLRKRYDQESLGWERDVGPKSSLSILRDKYERMLARGPHIDVKRAFVGRAVAPRLTLWDVQSTMALRCAPPPVEARGAPSSAVTRLALMRCKPLVVSSEASGHLRVYDYARDREVRRFPSGCSSAYRITGLTVLNEEAMLHNLDHPKTVQPPVVDSYYVDPRLLVLTGSSDGVVRIWGNTGIGGQDPVLGDESLRPRLVSSWCALEANVWQDTSRFEVVKRDGRVFRAAAPSDTSRGLAVEWQRARDKVYVSATHKSGMVSTTSQSTVWVWDLRSEMQAMSMSITNFSTVMLSQGQVPENAGITCLAAPPVPLAPPRREKDDLDDPEEADVKAPEDDNTLAEDLTFPAAHVLVCGCTDGSVRVLDDRMPGAVQHFTNGGRPAHNGPVVGMGFSSLLAAPTRAHGPPEEYDPSCRPVGSGSQTYLVTSGSRQGDLKVWDFRNMHWSLGGTNFAMENEALASAGSSEVVELAVNPLLASLATRTADGVVNLWDVRGGGEQTRALGVLPPGSSPVSSLAWHTEKHLLAAGGLDGEVRLFGEMRLPIDSITASLQEAVLVEESRGGRDTVMA